jgi:hypothetical protein
MGVAEQVQALKAKVQNVERVRAERLAHRDLAVQRRDEALEALRAEFGVSSVEEAEAKLSESQSAVEAQVARLTAELEGVSV